MFRSNVDIQYILDPYDCVAYVLDYINKSGKGLSKAMEEIYVKHKKWPFFHSFDMLKSLASAYYNSSEISAQEATYNFLGIRMVESSSTTIFVPTSRPEKRTHILKWQNELDKLSRDSTDCFVPGLIDHYTNRPALLDNINLAQFASYFEISLKNPHAKKRTTDDTFVDINEDNSEDDENIQADEQINNPSNRFSMVLIAVFMN